MLAQATVNHTPFIVFGLVTGVIWAVVCYRLAKKKGREPGVAAMLGLLFGIFAVIGYAAVKPKAGPHAVFLDPHDGIYWCETCGQHSASRAEALAHGSGYEPPTKPWSNRTGAGVPPAGGVAELPPRPDA